MIKYSLAVASVLLLALLPLRAQSHDDAFSNDGLVKIPDATKQPNFTLALHPETPKADLDSSCYVAMADFERNHVEDEIKAALQKKFNGQASPKLIPKPPKNPAPEDFLAYAYLFKNLSFANKFYKNDYYFSDKMVKGFGFAGEEQNDPAIRNQATILHYGSKDDFVVQLVTKSANEQLILAKVSPGDTLQETIAAVMKHVNRPETLMVGPDDKLLVPLLNFDVTSHFPQLEGLILSPSPAAKVHKLQLTSAMQNVRFQLNEEGVKLKSEATIVMGEMAVRRPVDSHIMIFDKPFLIIMKQKSSAQPYFALWVGNSDLFNPAN